MSSPTQRSLKELRRLGFVAGVVERWNPHAKIRQDLFGFIDIVALTPETWDAENRMGFLAIQSTTTANQAKRIEKIKAEQRALTWLKSGGRIFVHGWSMKGKKGKRKLWTLNETEIELKDFA